VEVGAGDDVVQPVMPIVTNRPIMAAIETWRRDMSPR
jgi:hypothetical protein